MVKHRIREVYTLPGESPRTVLGPCAVDACSRTATHENDRGLKVCNGHLDVVAVPGAGDPI